MFTAAGNRHTPERQDHLIERFNEALTNEARNDEPPPVAIGQQTREELAQ